MCIRAFQIFSCDLFQCSLVLWSENYVLLPFDLSRWDPAVPSPPQGLQLIPKLPVWSLHFFGFFNYFNVFLFIFKATYIIQIWITAVTQQQLTYWAFALNQIQYFVWHNSFSPHSGPMRKEVWLFPFYNYNFNFFRQKEIKQLDQGCIAVNPGFQPWQCLSDDSPWNAIYFSVVAQTKWDFVSNSLQRSDLSKFRLCL